MSWHSHVFTWLLAAGKFHSIPVILVRYEDLVSEPVKTCRQILDWLQIDRSTEHIRRAVDDSSIENLRCMEESETGSEMPGIFFTLESKREISQGWRFLADVRKNSYRSYLTDAEIELGLATFGAAMKTYGYL